MSKLKKCTKCGEEFPMNSQYFQPNKVCKDGFFYQCKICTAKRMKKYNEKNREKILENKKKYYIENKELIIERNLAYVERNRSTISERNRIYRLKNIDAYTNRDRVYYQNNKERIIKSVMLYRRKNKDQHRINEQKRKSKMHKLPCTLTVEQWKRVVLYFNNRCAYCGREELLTHDHFFPLSGGGEYTKENIIPSCRSCNSSKGKKLFFNWYPKQDFYNKKREDRILKHLGYKGLKQQLSIF